MNGRLVKELLVILLIKLALLMVIKSRWFSARGAVRRRPGGQRPSAGLTPLPIV